MKTGVVSSEEKKTLISNIFSLAVLQGTSYILPLITLPYLVRVLGVEKFGVLAFATSTINYFVIITDYGFNLTSSRDVSINREDQSKVTEIFSSVMIAKTFLLIVSFMLLAALVFSFEKFRSEWLIFILTFGTVIGQYLFPIWFFQGFERMKYVTWLSLLSKLIFTLMIFIFVRDMADYWLVPVFTFSGAIVAGFISLRIVRKEFGIKFKIQRISTVIGYMKEAHIIFVSNLAISLYTISTTFILGLLTNNTIVGYYASAEKIIQAFKGLLAPISQAIYPLVNRKVYKSKKEGLLFIRKITLYIGSLGLMMSIIILCFATQLVSILLGSQYTDSVMLLRIMFILPFLTGLSNIFGIQAMLAFNLKQEFRMVLVSGSVLNLILSFALVPMYKHIGSAVSVLIVECFITLATFTCLQVKNYKIIGEIKNV